MHGRLTKGATTKRQTKNQTHELAFVRLLLLHFDHASCTIVAKLQIKINQLKWGDIMNRINWTKEVIRISCPFDYQIKNS